MFVYKTTIYIHVLLPLYIYKFEKEKDFFFHKHIFPHLTLLFFCPEKLKINNIFSSLVPSYVLYGSVVSYVILYCTDTKYFVLKTL